MTTPARIKLPLQGTPAVNPDGTWSIPWYRVIVQFFRLQGNSQVALAEGVYLKEISAHRVDAFSTADDSLIGTLALKNIPGPTPTPEPPGAPGFTFTPAIDGTLTVFGGRVEMERDAGGFSVLSLCGGSFPMLVNDTARISWFTGVPPEVQFWGGA